MTVDDAPDRGLGKNVRRLRLGKGWTQAELSRRLKEAGWDIDPTAVTRLELGARSVQVRQLYVLAEVLEIDPGMLLPESGQAVQLLLNQVAEDLVQGRSRLRQALFRLDRLQSAVTGQGSEALAREVGLPDDLESLMDVFFVYLEGNPIRPIVLSAPTQEEVERRAELYRDLLTKAVDGMVETEWGDNVEHPEAP